MNIRKWAVVVFASLNIIMGCGDDGDDANSVTTEPEEPVRPPNYITLVIDDMGFSDLGLFGGEVPTPNIDQLASDGIILNNFYCGPTSTPSRGMLFTGKDNHPAGTGNMAGYMLSRPEQQGQPGYEGIMSLDVLPFAQVLQENGYHNMIVGKWDLGEEPDYYPINRGFDQTFVLLPGGDTHYLSDENGDVLTSHDPAKYASLGRESLYNKNGQEFKDFPPNAYAARYYTDMAIEMLDNRDKDKPFYLSFCHISPHSPLQAPGEVIDKYLEVYARGWDALRAERFEHIRSMGIFPENAELPPRPDEVPAWDSLSEGEQMTEAKRMATYAAMIDILDENIGRLTDHLREIGEYDNTVIFFLSDNGGEYKAAGRAPSRTQYLAENFSGDEDYENMGGPHSYITQTIGWGMLSNTPFRRYKRDTYEGGVHTVAFAHYPKSGVTGVKSDRLSSIMDIAPTLLDMADIEYPDTFNGSPNPPLQGISMAGLFDGAEDWDPERWIAWELDGVKGVRKGSWKLSQQRNDGTECWYDDWHLFNLADDPFERYDLADTEPEKLQEMVAIYERYAEENGVIELNPCPDEGDI